jgi:L-threonylcarbamoyladenylate synthase
MSTVKLSPSNADEIIQRAISILLNSGTIAYPTETIYGLGAKYDDEQAVKRLYALKNRPREKTIPIIIGNVEQLTLLAEYVNDTAADLISRFWPGPLTLLLRARDGLNSYITSDRKVAVRIPGESFALQLVRSAGFPITATSANISGKPPALNAAMVADYFAAGLDLIVDGSESKNILPSTIVDVTGETPIVLREGALKLTRLFTQ